MRQASLFAAVLAFASAVTAQKPRAPMPVEFENTTVYRWLNKPVLESRLLDNMENSGMWSLRGPGEMSFTTERSVDGKQSIRLRAKTKGTKQGGGSMGRPWGAASVVRAFPGEDWSSFNRLSFWVYPDLPGFRVVSLLVSLRNEGPQRGRPGHYVILRNHEWNHVVWEIPDLSREKVTAVALTYRLQGNEPDASDTVQYDFDKLELQRVDADPYEGWSVAPGRISFSNTGYPLNGPKRAIASDLKAHEFQLINQDTGQIVLTKPIAPVKSRVGGFDVLDFTEIHAPGTYILKAGDSQTRSFRIDVNIWRDTIWKTINFFYAERCGYEVPGVHLSCHHDWQGVHGDKRVIVNGGWHDAGDLSQGLVNTSEAVYAMFALAERLRANGQDPELAGRLIEEATWGLDWVMKVSFGDGYRVTWSTMDFWTNGIIGDVDDATSVARNSPFENFLSAAAEAIGSRVLKGEDAARAAHSLKMAQADWQFAVDGLNAVDAARANLTEIEGAGILASIDLFKLTGDTKYSTEAFRLAGLVMEAQQRAFLPGVEPRFAGFFYTSPEKSRLQHYVHRGHEQSAVMALARLCENFPDHPDYMKWYSAVMLHSEYFQKQMARFTDPYDHLPNGLWKPDEAERPNQAETVREQVENGWNVGGGYYLRMYPVQPAVAFRGNFGTVLSQTKAVSTAARLRANLELADLAQDQLEWVVGRNPFVQSTMYGEGYDYAPQYTAMSGDIVGSLPVGIKMLGNHDLPYWPATNSHNYKEVWVHPSSRWLWLMQDLAGPAVVKGFVGAGSSDAVKFRDKRTGYEITVEPDYARGEFRAEVPEGKYEITAGRLKSNLTVLPGRSYTLDLRPEQCLDWQVSSSTDKDGSVMIRVTARGEGSHSFALRTDNLSVAQPARTVSLRAGAASEIVWAGKLASNNSPWVALVVPDGNLDERQETFGPVLR